MSEPLAPLKVRITSLTGKQLRTVEQAVGVRMSRWEKELDSDIILAAALRSAVEGRPVEEYLDYPVTDLLESVDIIDSEDDPGNA